MSRLSVQFRAAASPGWPIHTRHVLALLALLCLFLLAGPMAPDARAGLFGSREVERTGALATFRKWDGVLDRYGTEQTVVPPPCRGRGYDACPYPDWVGFIERTSRLDKLSQLQEVARYFDRLRYIEDMPNWGQNDYWATPGQFISRNGDCEDFAISKYATLRHLGWSLSDLRIVYVQDLNLQIGHMVLAATLDGTTYILDNQARNQLVRHDRIRHYRPVYSLSGDRWWRHIPRR
ncbi:transglutaminase-like cysteine peptidase [Roseospira goensis]|uniref:Putative transglutaminase-like cysteine proteinase n=1 Tax=Roseospira goensis TaxID=391922 RepID=A0A7W6RZC9_9PROT|nr:transglutaminase-like cysteine peptidase [Roseospira goensis]MBB4286040.1 putative transglutaminase-like cysteine proteinase [Roseospira goensis]